MTESVLLNVLVKKSTISLAKPSNQIGQGLVFVTNYILIYRNLLFTETLVTSKAETRMWNSLKWTWFAQKGASVSSFTATTKPSSPELLAINIKQLMIKIDFAWEKISIFDVFFSSKVKYIACKTMVKPLEILLFQEMSYSLTV